MNFNFRQHLRASLLATTAALLVVSAPCASAQAVFGQILGTVTDPTGAAIPNATITVTDVAKGTSVTLTSNGAGEFTAEHLIPDTYTVKVAAPGFKAFEQTQLTVNADESPKVSAILTIGASDQVVEVNADEVPQLKTDKADVSTIFNAEQVEELPIPDHNFTNLQLLLPGAQQLGWAHATDENPQASKQIQVDGQAFGGVSYMLDGTDNQDPILGIIVINPNSDSLSEAKITTQNFDAEFGKAVASFITVQTKSGTNAFHGTLFDNRESNANLARDPFAQSPSELSATNPFPGGLKNQFGGSIGGPILKDKLFFFGDYQGVRQKVGISNIQTVPSALLVSTCLGTTVGTSGIPGCDFSEYLDANSNSGNPGHVIYDPTTGNPFPGNVIPKARLSSQALGLLKLLQPYAPNNITTSNQGLTNNYAAGGTGIFNSNQWDVRGDYTLNERVHFFGRFSRFTDIETGNVMFGAAGGEGFGLGGYGGSSNGANDSLALGSDIAVNPKLVTDVRLGYYRYNIITSKYDQSTAFATNLGIPGENLGSTITSGAPDFSIADLTISGNSGPNNSQGEGAQYGAGLNVDHCNCPLIEKEDQFQIVNNWTKTLGNHSVKFGVDLRYARNLRVPSDNDRTGVNNFGSGPTSNGTAGTGDGFATFVLGDVTAYNRYVSASTNAKEFQQRFFYYGQDTWRATPKLTINAGLRLEEYSPERVNGTGNGALMDLTTGYIHVAGVGSVPLNMGVARAKFPFNPRLGVAYQLNPKTVIRAGYGRSFDLGVFGSEFGHVVTQNIPVLANQSISSTGGYASDAFNLATGPVGYVNYTVPSNGLLPNPGASVNTKARPFTMRLPTLDAWNITVQRSITPTLSVTAAYVGNKGTHTLSAGDGNNTNPNEPGIALPAALSSISSGGTQIPLHYDSVPGDQTYTDSNHVTHIGAIPAFCTANPTQCSSGVPLSGTYAGATNNQTLLQRYVGGSLPACDGPCGWTQGISYYGDNQDTHYNALQISAAKTYTHGLSANVNYAYQRASNFASGYATWNKSVTNGADDSIRRSQITGYGLYKLPFGHNQKFLTNANGFVNALVGGFEFSPVLVYSSGLPFTLTYDECGNYVPNNSAPCYPNGNGAGLKTGASGVPGTNSGVSFFKSVLSPAAQQAKLNLCTASPSQITGGFSCPGLDTIGNTGRNTAWGPHFFNGDLSLQKNFTIREKYTAQMRVDAFNGFNHINYANPGGSVESGGSISGGPGPGGTTNPRQLQFTGRIQF
jgi:hypothetical protein